MTDSRAERALDRTIFLPSEILRLPKTPSLTYPYGSLLQAKNADGSYMTIEEIKTECFILMVAASDTTAAFICPFVNNVAQDIRVYSKLRAEIEHFEQRDLLSSPVVKFDETNAMPYFMACVKETLRYSPSTPMIMPRYVSQNGMELNGIWVPERTEVGANPYVIHRNTAVFGEDADLFRPERWLENDERTKTMDKYLMSWGYGTRTCLGKNIAQLETQKLCLQVCTSFPLIRLVFLLVANGVISGSYSWTLISRS